MIGRSLQGRTISSWEKVLVFWSEVDGLAVRWRFESTEIWNLAPNSNQLVWNIFSRNSEKNYVKTMHKQSTGSHSKMYSRIFLIESKYTFFNPKHGNKIISWKYCIYQRIDFTKYFLGVTKVKKRLVDHTVVTRRFFSKIQLFAHPTFAIDFTKKKLITNWRSFTLLLHSLKITRIISHEYLAKISWK